MKMNNILLPATLMLLSAFYCRLEAQNQTAPTGLQANEQEPLLHINGAKGDGYWQPTIDEKGIYYYPNGNPSRVGIGTNNPNVNFLLDVVGVVGVNQLVITDQYSLPTERGKENEFLNGEGKWAVPAGGGGGGESFWQPVGLNNGIYYDIGRVGIGTATPGADLHVQGNMKLGTNIGNVGTNAFAGGDESVATGTNSFAFGDGAKATNSGAFAVGLRAEASGKYSTAFGRVSKASNENAIALGYVTEATTPNSIVIGKHARVTAGNSYLIGSGTGTGNGMIVNSFDYSFMIGMKSNLPTFFVGSSDGAGTTGRIGIANVTDPQDKLHIRADATETATIRLEPTATSGAFRFAHIYMGAHSISAANTANMVFKTPATNRHFVFENGSIRNTNGSAATPAYSFVNSTNTGMFRPEANTIALSTAGIERLRVSNTGNVGIGTTNNPRGKLDVVGDTYIEGVIFSEEVIVEQASNWPDYVFDADYQLMDLAELKSYIGKNKHLPGTPKADENGNVQNLKLSEMNALLLKKIEELTLYILKQEERILRLESVLEQ